MRLESYVGGTWVAGRGDERPFVNPVSGAVLGTLDAAGVDAPAAFEHARDRGGAALADLSFAARGALLKAVADVLSTRRERYGEIARLNSGNTAADAAIDIDGAIGTLKVFARYGQALGGAHTILEAGYDPLAREPVFGARHVWHTRPGAALQINAFNFPAWGLWEKIAVAVLAGVPCVAKPASATAWLAAEMVRDVVDATVLPPGVLSLVCGSGDTLAAALGAMDSLAFTGSAETARVLLANLPAGPRVTVEADSLNATVLGPDVVPGMPLFDLFVREVVKALSVKAGQLCTNIRRVLVPAVRIDDVIDAVAAALAPIVPGDPADPAVRMGPLVNARQRDAAAAGLAGLMTEARPVAGGARPAGMTEADWTRGAFMAPTLLLCAAPGAAKLVHALEVFGPCATLLPYDDLDSAGALAARGGGSLACSLFTDDVAVAAALTRRLAPGMGAC